MQRFKTELCRNWMRSGQCMRGGPSGTCTFAHGEAELRTGYSYPDTCVPMVPMTMPTAATPVMGSPQMDSNNAPLPQLDDAAFAAAAEPQQRQMLGELLF